MVRMENFSVHSGQQLGPTASEIKREARYCDLIGQRSIQSPNYKHCNKLCECCMKMRHSMCEDSIEKRNSSEVEQSAI
jgi:hypothetical protein